jgi:hypothetical protein
MVYVYLLGTGVTAILWLVFYITRKDLRRKLILSSLFLAPIGISERLFIPEYWNPQFQTIPISENIFLGSILFCFFSGGFVAVLYQVTFKEKIFDIKCINPFITLVGPTLLLLYPILSFQVDFMKISLLSMFVGGIITLFNLEYKIRKKVIYSATFNTLVYFAFFFIFWYSFPTLSLSYNFNNLSNFRILGTPLEEILWVFSFSLYWTPMYEIWRNVKRK